MSSRLTNSKIDNGKQVLVHLHTHMRTLVHAHTCTSNMKHVIQANLKEQPQPKGWLELIWM